MILLLIAPLHVKLECQRREKGLGFRGERGKREKGKRERVALGRKAQPPSITHSKKQKRTASCSAIEPFSLPDFDTRSFR